MNYRKLRELLFDMVFMNNEFIPREFSYRNKEYLMKYVDSNLKSYCNVMFRKDVNRLKQGLILLTSLLSFYLFIKFHFTNLTFRNPSFWILLFLVYSNLNFIFSSKIFKVVHKTHVKSNYKVVVKKSTKDLFGYYLAYVGFDDKGRLVVISLNRLKKKIKLVNPKVFLVDSHNLETILIDYLYSDKPKDLTWLKSEIFLDIQTEYFKDVAREQAIEELVKINS